MRSAVYLLLVLLAGIAQPVLIPPAGAFEPNGDPYSRLRSWKEGGRPGTATHPGHQSPPARNSEPGYWSPRVFGNDRTDPITVLYRTDPYWRVGKLDRRKSSACASGRFNSDQGNRLVARFSYEGGGAVLMAVPDDRADLLHDPGGLAKAGEVYLFRNNNWGDCEVYVIDRPVRNSKRR